MVFVHGASVIVDRRDVIPQAVEMAGGRVDHFGMPVDPGNMLLLCHLGETPVLGLPGCARSPKVNGFDWVLERLVAGVPVGPQDIMRMAPAASSPKSRRARCRAPRRARLPRPSLPKEIAARTAHRGAVARRRPIQPDGIEQAARRSRGPADGGARRAAAAVLPCPADHRGARQRSRPGRCRAWRIAGRAGAQPGFRRGVVGSLKRGLAALPPDIDGVIVCLGDMPLVAGRDLDRLIAAFNPLEGRAIVVPTRHGKRGNPVLWARRFIPEMAELAGDVGAKHLIGEYAELVAEVEMDSDGVLIDIDTPDALAALRDKVKPSAA